MDIKRFIRPGQGAADITPLLRDGAAFHAAIAALAERFAGAAFDRVACVEGRGFLVGAALAHRLAVGLNALRRPGGLKSAIPPHRVTYVDYTRREQTLEMHADAVQPGDRILIIDDWVETAGTIRAAIALIEGCGGVVAGIGALIDDTPPQTRRDLERTGYHAL